MPFQGEPWEYALLSLVGILAGFLNVVAGGGSLMTMPLMTFMGLPDTLANGTNRIAIFAQNLSATISFFRQKISDFKLSITLSLSAMPGTIFGAYIGLQLKGAWFNRTLAIVIVAVLISMLIKQKRLPKLGEGKTIISPRRLIFGHICMFFIGLYGGILQAGVGFVIIAVLQRVLRLDLVRVNMHKVFIIGSYTIVAIVIYAVNGQVAWIAGLFLAVGMSVGAWVGSRWQVKSGEQAIRLVVQLALAVMAVKLLLF